MPAGSLERGRYRASPPARASRAAALLAALWLGSACGSKTHGDEPSLGDSGADAPPSDAARDALGPDAGESGPGVGVDAEAGAVVSCAPPPTTLRRLSHFEYDNTLRDLLAQRGAASAFSPEGTATGFANDESGRDVSLPLAQNYREAAARAAERATGTAAALAALAPCAAAATPGSASSCARTIAESFGARAFRRPLASDEVDGLVALHDELQAAGADFPTSVAGVIQAMLQSPEFLYRVESGIADPAAREHRRPSGHEMATRLSYFFWGSVPDDALRAAATSGELMTAAGVRAQAARLLDDPRAREVVRYFFDKLLRLDQLPGLTRDPVAYPTFSSDVTRSMREEAGAFVENAVFQENASYPQLLSAPYTFVDATLARFYGMTAVPGAAFVNVPADGAQRLGLLTQGGVLAASVSRPATSAMSRGAFVANRLLCRRLEKTHADVALPEPAPGVTAREHLSTATAAAACSSCHSSINPLGFALDRYDAVGLYRNDEEGATLDAEVEVPGIPGPIHGALELARKLAELPEAQDCFADQWLTFANGRTLDDSDACVKETTHEVFRRAGYNVRELLLELTQTDAFLYARAPE